MDGLTQVEYAKLRGCSKQYIGKMMREGLPHLVGDGGDKRIDAQAADRWLDARRDPARTANGRSAMLDDDGAAGAADGDTASAYMAARTEKAQSDAKLARMAVEVRAGGLVSAEGVKRQHFEAARRVRDAFAGLGRALAGELMSLTDEREIRAVFTREVNKVLLELADEFGERAGDRPEFVGERTAA